MNKVELLRAGIGGVMGALGALFILLLTGCPEFRCFITGGLWY